MMHKAWSSIEEVPYWFSRSSIKLQGHTKLPVLSCFERFRTVTTVWIHRWIWMMHRAWCSIEVVPCYCLRLCIKFQGHTGCTIYDFDPIWVRLLGRSQLWNHSDLHCLPLAAIGWFKVLARYLVGWCTVPWIKSLFKMTNISPFHGTFKFPMFGLDQVWETTLPLFTHFNYRPEIWRGYAWYHEADWYLKWPCLANACFLYDPFCSPVNIRYATLQALKHRCATFSSKWYITIRIDG